MRRIILLLMALSFGFTTYSQEYEVKVMTYNVRYANPNDGVNYWENRKEKVFSIIREHAPDLIGFQEVLESQATDLAEAMEDYSWVGTGRDDGINQGEFSPVFYRSSRFRLLEFRTFWLSETPQKPSKGWDAALPRIATWARLYDLHNEKVILFVNTHFDHRGEMARTNSAALLESLIAASNASYTILTGDFNFTPDKTGYQNITLSLNDSWLLVPHDDQQEGTYKGFAVTEEKGNRIDYIFVSDEIRVNSYEVDTSNDGENYPSDHMPVIITLTLNNPE